MYQLTHDETTVIRLTNKAYIPVDNTKYQAWLAKGNTPEPADPLPEPTSRELAIELAKAFLSENHGTNMAGGAPGLQEQIMILFMLLGFADKDGNFLDTTKE